MARKKIALIGAGMIGGTLAHLCATKGLGDVVLFDVVEGLPQGKALDLAAAGPVEGFDCVLKGTNDYADLRGADVCIVTAGIARKPGMSRDDLIGINAKIVKTVAENIKQHAPGSFVIVVSNPLDAMVTLMKRVTGFPKQRVVGMAGVLDSARYRFFVAQAVGVSVANVEALVLGGHGDDMVPVRSCCRVAGMPVEKFLSSEVLDSIEKRVRGAGAEVVKLLGVGSAFASPAWAALEMAEAIAFDQKKILPAAALLNGEYGVTGLFIGVPCVLGNGGIERIIEVDLTDAEKGMFRTSIASVTGSCAEVARAM